MIALTVLNAPRKRLTKAYGRDRDGKFYKTAYDKPLLFRSQAYPVETVDDLAELLQDLQLSPDCCLVMAAAGRWHPGPGQPVRRLIHAAAELVDDRGRYRKPARKGSAAEWEAREIEAGRLRPVTALPMFEEQPTSALLLDFDRATMPAGIEWRADLSYTAAYLRLKLPPDFRDCRAVYYATASAADLTKPDLGGATIRMRLGFVTDRGVLASEAKRWLAGVDGLDPCTLTPAQVIYTAAPQYLDGLTDPLPDRLGLLDGGQERVAVPALPVPQRPKREASVSLGPVRSAEGLGLVTPHPLLDAAAAQVTGDAGTVRSGLMQCAFAYIADVGRDHVDVDALAEFLTEVGEQHRTTDEVAEYGLPGAISWALEHAPEPVELTPEELAMLRRTVARSPVSREIWTGARSYPSHGKAHFALVAALARAGLHHHETLSRVLLAYDRRHGCIPAHPDYTRRTIAAALATTESGS